MRLADPHLNVFQPYRGPTAAGEPNERQLENNLTRALAVCLTRLGPSKARTLLLQELGILPERAEGFERCELQVGAADANWPHRSKRSITVVTGTAADAVSTPDTGTNGILDLVIVGHQFVLGVESKIGSKVTEGQLAGHAKTLNIALTAPKSVTWASLARCARAIRASEVLNPVARFVLEQFEEYLRMNGFGGFTNDHFAYFALGPDERVHAQETRAAIRRQLKGLVQQIKVEWPSTFTEHVGRILNTESGTFAALKPTELSSKTFGGQRPHLSIVILPSGISIFFNVETGHAYKQFLKAWEGEKESFLDLLRGLSPTVAASLQNAWRLEVEYRIPLGKPQAKRNEPSLHVAALTARSMPRELLTAMVTEAIKTPPGGWSPEIKIVRHYDARLVCADADFLEKLVADARSLEPFFDWVGEPVR